MGKYVCIVALVLLVVVPVFGEWEKRDSGLNETDFYCIAVHPKTAGLLFVGSRRGVYRSADAGRQWQEVLAVRKTVHAIYIDGENNVICAATEAGLFVSHDQGLTWKLVYRGQGSGRDVLCVARAPKLFIGTGGGLLVEKDNQRTWERVDGAMMQDAIIGLCVDKQTLYAASETSVSVSTDGGMSFTKLFENIGKTIDELPDELDVGQEMLDEEQKAPSVRCVAVDSTRSGSIYVGTNRGVMYSVDAGKTWAGLTNSGLLARDIYYILVVDGVVYAGTSNGVYVFDSEDDRWQQAYAGLSKGAVRMLAFDVSLHTFWLAGEAGVNSFKKNTFIEEDKTHARGDFSAEPAIAAVQKLAIEYAEATPEKISRWRKQARIKALLPKVSFGWDNSSSNTYEIYTSATRDYCVRGPEDITSGWDVTASWELSDIIWGTDQTSIDVRSRLTVELRNDILDEVNRAYFERRRLLMELTNGYVKDAKKRAEKELRVEELTAVIDGYTGGGFSRMLASARKTR